MFYFDPMYFVFIIPGLALALLATYLTKTTFAQYSQFASRSGLSGARAAYEMLVHNGINDVNIESVAGSLTDHYDPSTKTLRLSENVYHSNSLSAIGVACHEAGHAMQHAYGYALLGLRTALVPVTNFCSTLYAWVIMFGMFLQAPSLIMMGIVMCGMAVLFAVVTLPIEWDASARAKVAMVNIGLVSPQESVHAGKVLNAAFLTYVASAITAISTLLYYVFRLGLLGQNQD